MLRINGVPSLEPLPGCSGQLIYATDTRIVSPTDPTKRLARDNVSFGVKRMIYGVDQRKQATNAEYGAERLWNEVAGKRGKKGAYHVIPRRPRHAADVPACPAQ